MRDNLMGLLNQAMDIAGDKQPPIPHFIDSDKKLIETALALLANNGQAGGIYGLMDRFKQAGLEEVMNSWIEPGQNLPISADQIKQVLDIGHLKQIAEETGYTEEEAANQLSDLLPAMVDQFTSAGTVPQEGLGNVSDLRERFAQSSD